MTARDNHTWLASLSCDGPVHRAALSDLRNALMRNLRKALSGRVTDDAFLEDAVQDAILRILDRQDQFAGRSQFLTWSTSIAIRVAMSELRRRRWRDVSLNEVIESSGFAPDRAIEPAATVEIAWEQRAIVEKLYELIREELTDKQRSALLAELKGMPQEEIARHLGSNRNAVYKLSHDARKRLKRGLEAAGYEASDIHAAFAK